MLNGLFFLHQLQNLARRESPPSLPFLDPVLEVRGRLEHVQREWLAVERILAGIE